MKLFSLIVSASTLILGAFSYSVSALPKCSARSLTPCECPSGTDYAESVTFSVIGAKAKDVEQLMNNFYVTGWWGAVPFKTKGPNNTPGVSIRTTHFPTPIGVYDISELLVEDRVQKDGSFIQVFEQLKSTIPVEYHTKNGSFSGFWITLQATQIFQYETLVRWSVYACETGHVRNFARFHETALKNASSILKAAGKVKGISVDPYSVQGF